MAGKTRRQKSGAAAAPARTTAKTLAAVAVSTLVAVVAVAGAFFPRAQPSNGNRSHQAPNGTVLRAIPREHNLSVADFIARYSSTGLPVIVSGALEAWPARTWDLRRFDELCGARPLYPTCAARDGHVKVPSSAALGHTWGAVFSVLVGEWLPTIGDLLAAQGDPSWQRQVDVSQDGVDVSLEVRGPDLYLHDAPIEKLCPAALAELRAPRYFPVDYRMQLAKWAPPAEGAEGERCELRHHPSIFIGRGGSQSGLHRDSEGTRFWMAMLRGEKSFRLLDQQTSLEAKFRWPSSCVRGTGGFLRAQKRVHKPSLVAEMCPQYAIDLFAAELPPPASAEERAEAGDTATAGKADSPLVVWEGSVGAGEMLFIPEGWAHQVLNLSPTIGVSANFVDAWSMRGHTKLMLDQLDFALLEKRVVGWEAGSERAQLVGESIERLSTRIRHMGFAEWEGRFPAAVAAELPAELAARDATWAEFFAINTLEEPADVEEEEARARRMEGWLQDGGVGRLIRRMGSQPEQAIGDLNAQNESLRQKRVARIKQVIER